MSASEETPTRNYIFGQIIHDNEKQFYEKLNSSRTEKKTSTPNPKKRKKGIANNIVQISDKSPPNNPFIINDSYTSKKRRKNPFQLDESKLDKDKEKTTFLLFATECEFQRKSQDSGNEDLEIFFDHIQSESKDEIKHYVNFNKRYNTTDFNQTDNFFGSNPEANLAPTKFFLNSSKQNDGSSLNESLLNHPENISKSEKYNIRYTNIYLYKDKKMDIDKFIDLLQEYKTVKDFNRKYINIRECPEAANHLKNKVYGKYNHKLYEISNYRMKNPSYNLSIHYVLENAGEIYTLKNEKKIYEIHSFWMLYLSVAEKNDKGSYMTKNKTFELNNVIAHRINMVIKSLKWTNVNYFD
tara:strand:+ start:600 stop:1661 length:1062 start_codon:yes stop_codon:yes gene_type:complete